MSIKSTLLISSLFVILCSQQNFVWADYDSPSIAADDEIADLQSKHDMAPLLEDSSALPAMREDNTAMPTMNEDVGLPQLQFTAQLSTMAHEESAQKFLDSISLDQYLAPSPAFDTVKYDALMVDFANKTQFSTSENTATSDVSSDSVTNEMLHLDPLALSLSEDN